MPEQAAAAAAEADLASEYFGQLLDRCEQAAAAMGGAGKLDLEMAGLRLRLRYAGESLRDGLLAPFEHLAGWELGDPDLTISLFDTASGGIEPPPPLWKPIAAAAGTNPVSRLRSERACVLAAAGSRGLTAALPAEGVAVFHLPDAAAIPSNERAAPIREALQLLMSARGRLMTHAGAVGRDGRGVLLVGCGGSGKSTLALSCALAGMEIVADDYVLLEPGPPPVVHAMQSTAKLTEDSALRLGIPTTKIDPAGFEPTLEGPEKALMDIRVLAPAGLSRRLCIRAIVAPTVSLHLPPYTGGKDRLDETEPVVRAISAAEGLRAVAPSTIVQSGFAGDRALAALAGLVRGVPSYSLGLSPDPTANAAVIDQLVGELG